MRFKTNNKKKSYILSVIGLSIIFSFSLISAAESENDAEINYLWNRTVRQYLTDTLWNKDNIYDAGHYLMVPLHYAFLSGNREWKTDFHHHFKLFSENLSSIDKSVLNKTHYLYLLSRYLVLSNNAHEYYKYSNILFEFLVNELDEIWYSPAWQWDSKPFESMKDRIEWKLSSGEVKPNYYKAILDEDLFVFAIAGDIRQIVKNRKINEPYFISEILEYADLVFHRVIYYKSDGSWLFQPGVWSDHPDFLYAGQRMKDPLMEQKPISNISWDSGHSHRFPLWLKSLQDATEFDSEDWNFYKKLLDGLEITFIKNVLVWPSENFRGIRLNNYMDGNNGIYRWNYITQGQNNGYGPYELSGIFFLGWWAFLDSDSISRSYEIQSKLFPLNQVEIALYVGPNTTRIRNPLVTQPAVFSNGFTELLTRLAVSLNSLKH